jgi:hypothetical protein
MHSIRHHPASVGTQIRQFGRGATGHGSDQDAAHSGGYLKSPPKNASDQGVCGGDMSPPNGMFETRNTKSGSEKGIDAGHAGDITSGATKTSL